jgi:hypothetical protein
MSNLSPDQFREYWHEPDEPGVGYHVSPPENRESIERRGLRPGSAHRGLGNPGGVYVHHSLHGPTSYRQEGDLYKVDLSGLEHKLQPDAVLESFDVHASSLPHSVPRKRVQRVGEVRKEGIRLFE